MASESTKRRRKRRRKAGRPASPGEAETSRSEERVETSASASAPARQSTGAPRRRRGNIDDERPPAPWGSFPLIEIAVFVGLVMLVLGFFFVGGSRGVILIVTGLLLGSISGLELAIREHFAGYRSHTLLLAGFPAAAVLGVLFYADPNGLPPLVRALIGVAAFAAGAVLLIRVFRKRSGGHSFRFSSFNRR